MNGIIHRCWRLRPDQDWQAQDLTAADRRECLYDIYDLVQRIRQAQSGVLITYAHCNKVSAKVIGDFVMIWMVWEFETSNAGNTTARDIYVVWD